MGDFFYNCMLANVAKRSYYENMIGTIVDVSNAIPEPTLKNTTHISLWK